jgi:2'-hydroxyisoflavone reductase
VRILVLGGTQFVGRAFVEAALAEGHDLTLFHRGRTGDGLFPDVEHVLSDRDGGLAALGSRTWDVCVDVSGYLPRLVGDSASYLRDGVERYLYVSTISVYADLAVSRDESGPLATIDDETTEEIGIDTYGALKAACERRVDAVFGERASHVRPGYVIGPYDHTGRFPWFVHRAARGGDMLVPASMMRAFQAIDSRDLGDFLLRVAQLPQRYVLNATGPVPPVGLGDLLDETARQVGADLTLVPADDAFLEAQGVESREIPLWPGDDPDWAAWAQIDVSRALEAGLRFRPIEDVVAATLAHTETVEGVGLTPERESELLAAWRAR